jgi:hypothetical protein
VRDIAKEMALTRGLVALVGDGMGAKPNLDVAHAIGLRHALAMLERRGLVTCYVGGWVELTRAGTGVVGECAPETKEAAATDCHALD